MKEEVTKISYGCVWCYGDVDVGKCPLPPTVGTCTKCGRILTQDGMYLKSFIPGGCTEGEFPQAEVTIKIVD